MLKSVSVEEYRSMQKKPIRQIEGATQCTFGQLLNFSYKTKLSPNLIFWTYSASGEKKSLKTAVLQKRKGMQKGDLDYRFHLAQNRKLRVVMIEFKTNKGSLTPEQKEFFARHEGLENAKCYIARSVEEAVEICYEEKILIK